MSTITSDLSYLSGAAPGGLLSVPLGIVVGRVDIPISGPNFQYRLQAQIISEELVGGDKFIARFTVDENVDFILTLIGKQIDQGARFEWREFSLNHHISDHRPRAHFVASTLMATFALAGGFHLRIPELKIDQTLNIAVPLPEISKLLQSRQMAYRFMVIEQATGTEFLLPISVPPADKSALAFIYHAIVDRSFVWHSGKLVSSIPARKESLALPFLNQPSCVSNEEDSFSRTLLDQSISLGPATITIGDAVVEHLDAVRRELESDDGHQVRVEIHSLSGREKYDFLEAPRLPKLPWDSKIKGLIDLESGLDSALFMSYNALAAASLNGLSEEEKAEITARPEIGEAFLIDNASMESV